MTEPDVPGGVTRDEHIAACIGCQHIQRRGHVKLTCYDMAARAAYAGRTLSVLFKLRRQPSVDGEHDQWVGLPPNVPEIVDAVVAHFPANSIDLERDVAIRRWVEPYSAARYGYLDDEVRDLQGLVDGAWIIRCQCQLTPTDVLSTRERAGELAALPCGRCGEGTPAQFLE